MAEKPRLRCAIYTRKSSEEGLEQDFNSLHAQREACEAYISSQKHEGWKQIPILYDDGGFSGGSMQRPALDRLLADIKARSIDVVVVYKVDRLTRSLTDFAKIVEVFDGHGVSFVSVTQAFNTTSSMGRLTLNVLLSFAQFEREVTGERIRDKIAASKKKGMWMGGNVPLGYDAHERTLKINSVEAETVRLIFNRYLHLKSVDRLNQEMSSLDLRTKVRPGRMDHIVGGRPFSRGHLYRILSNPLYIGKISHKGEIHDGLHQPIIDDATWTQTQETLAANHHEHRSRSNAKNPSLLAGLLIDQDGRRLIASHAVKDGKRYRYYISCGTKGRGSDPDSPAATSAWRLPAGEIEDAVISILRRRLLDHEWLLASQDNPVDNLADRRQILDQYASLAQTLELADNAERREILQRTLSKICLRDDRIELLIIMPERADQVTIDGKDARTVMVVEPLSLRRKNGELKIIVDGNGSAGPEPDPALVRALAQAHRWWRDLTEGRFATLREVAKAYDTDERYAAWIIRLAFISPKLTAEILHGEQPWDFTLQSFIKSVSLR